MGSQLDPGPVAEFVGKQLGSVANAVTPAKPDLQGADKFLGGNKMKKGEGEEGDAAEGAEAAEGASGEEAAMALAALKRQTYRDHAKPELRGEPKRR